MAKASRYSIFIGLILFLFALGDAVVYEAVALAFTITSGWLLLHLSIGLGVLSLSFVAATILGNYFYNWFTRTYYTIAAAWTGSLLYIFLASFIYGISVMIFETMPREWGVALLCVAAVLSIYGLLHARHLSVTNVTVQLPHLPPAWENKKAVWISDLHLGQLNGSSFAKRVAKKINSLSPDILFIGGDLFDGTIAPNLVELAAPLADITAPLGKYFVTGNHEEFENSAVFIDSVQAIGVTVLMDEMIEVEGLQIVGVDYLHTTDKETFKTILAGLSINPHKPSILLKHEPSDLSVAEAAGISLQISGHTHLGQQWPLGYIAQMAYRGFAYGLNTLGSMQVYTSSGVGTWGPPLRVATKSEIVLFTFRT